MPTVTTNEDTPAVRFLFIRFKATPQEREQLYARAEAAGMSASDYIRSRVDMATRAEREKGVKEGNDGDK
jgi:hypothetical protein